MVYKTIALVLYITLFQYKSQAFLTISVGRVDDLPIVLDTPTVSLEADISPVTGCHDGRS